MIHLGESADGGLQALSLYIGHGAAFESPMLPRFRLPARNRLPVSSRFVEVAGTGKPEGINRLSGRPRVMYGVPSFQDAAAEARIEQAKTGPRCAHAGETADIEVLTVAVRQKTAPDKMTLGLPVVDFTVQSQRLGVDGLLSESQSTHAMVAEADACRYLWENFGINLLLLELYQAATTPNLAWMAEHPLMTDTTRQKAAQAYKGELANRLRSFRGNFSQPCVPYYELAGLLELVAHLEGDLFGLGKTSLEKPALPCGMVFANVLDQPSILCVDLRPEKRGWIPSSFQPPRKTTPMSSMQTPAACAICTPCSCLAVWWENLPISLTKSSGCAPRSIS